MNTCSLEIHNRWLDETVMGWKGLEGGRVTYFHLLAPLISGGIGHETAAATRRTVAITHHNLPPPPLRVCVRARVHACITRPPAALHCTSVALPSALPAITLACLVFPAAAMHPPPGEGVGWGEGVLCVPGWHFDMLFCS